MVEINLDTQILILMRKKYNYINEINRITLEIADALSRNDGYSAELLLDMRSEEMENVDKCNEDINTLLLQIPEEKIQKYKELTKGKQEIDCELTQIQSKIIELRDVINAVLIKTIEVDKIINIKIRGN